VRAPALPLILIAEAVPDERELYADYFAWSGFRVVTAESGRATLARAADRVPDVISAAFDLPDLDGAALCSALRSNPATANVPVILLATRASSDDIARARAAGCADVLLKPVLPEQLLLEARRRVPRSRLILALSQRLKLRAARARLRATAATQNAERILRKLRK
jgi:CheY-like chemotaxis protein